MKCGNCQAEPGPGEIFCAHCGKPVHTEIAPDAAPPASTMLEPITAQTAAVPAQATGGWGLRICPRCGSGVEAGNRFCGTCANDMLAALPQPPAEPPPLAFSPAAPEVFGPVQGPGRGPLFGAMVAVAAILLLAGAGFGLWVWLGRGARQAVTPPKPTPTASVRPANANMPANANRPEKKVSVAGTWNCVLTAPGEEAASASLVLEQNGTAVTGTLAGERESVQLTGTLEGQKLSFEIAEGSVKGELVLSPDGAAMSGEARSEDGSGMISCKR